MSYPMHHRSLASIGGFHAATIVLALLGGVAATAPARAQSAAAEASEADKAAALKSYTAGKKAFEKGKYQEALTEFEASFTAVPSPNSRVMVAQCLEKLGKLVEARAAYEDTIRMASEGDAAKYAGASAAAREALDRLDSQLARVQVRVSGLQGDAILTVAGRTVPRAEWDAPIAVAPGEVSVMLESADGKSNVQSVTAVAGRTQEVVIDATPPSEPLVDVNFSGAQKDEGDADAAENPLEKRADLGLVFGGKVGGAIGTGAFGGSFIVELELEYLLPLPAPVNHSLGLFASVSFTQPKTDGTEGEPDPRLPGDGVLKYEVTQQQLALSLGALYRIPVGLDFMMPYGGLGARIYMQNTKVTASGGGESFGENEETQTDVGLLVIGGVDFFLGPGALLAEIQFGYAALDGFVMRDTNVGALNFAVGYRFIL